MCVGVVGIEPGDVAQGKLGNCWLLAAIASLAEFPGAIENCFKTYGVNARHKYKINIYDARKDRRKWVEVTVDDFIPVECVYDTSEARIAATSPSDMRVESHPFFLFVFSFA